MPIPPPPRSVEQWALEQSNYFLQVLMGIITNQQTIIAGQQTIVANTEKIMATQDSLSEQLRQVKTDVASAVSDLAESVAHQIEQLREALDNNVELAALRAAAQETVDSLDDVAAQARAMKDSLSADDAPAPPADPTV